MPRPTKLIIRDFMRPAPYRCRRADRADHVLTAMDEHELDVMCVTNEDNRPIALFTAQDACRAAIRLNARLHEFLVDAAVSEERIPTCVPSDSVDHAERLMRLHQTPTLPIIDSGGRLVGTLHLGDLAQASTAPAEAGPEEADIVSTLAAVRS